MNIAWLVAATEKIDPESIGLTDPVRDPNEAVATVMTTVYMWAGIVSVLIIIIAGYYYVTSSGDPAGIKRAKQAIIGAAVGLVVVIGAFVITQFVLGRF